ncbi:MAG: hypothetical protein SFU86_10450 [Pirellulaceae bacterium]|nr:hypothetical protein [Pirellulaceae bacterium]
MPIRFACPKCQQKLSVSSRKAGMQADCPRCKESITIPAPRPAPVAAGPAPAEPDEEPSAAALNDAELPTDSPAAEEDQEPYPTFSTYEDTHLVYDTDEAPPPTFAPDQQDMVTVPRYVLYLQGGLLAVVAFSSFAIGLLAGGAFGGGTAEPGPPQACTLSGTVNYLSGGRTLPDLGAVVVVIPQSKLKPDEKAPIDGLRPGDPTPDETHRGVAILRELGGGYARADDKGHFAVKIPSRGRYQVLVISRERQVRTIGDLAPDILKLSPFFDNASDLLGRQRYQLTMESLRGDQQHNVVFN